jgi:hypothetical protein
MKNIISRSIMGAVTQISIKKQGDQILTLACKLPGSSLLHDQMPAGMLLLLIRINGE